MEQEKNTLPAVQKTATIKEQIWLQEISSKSRKVQTKALETAIEKGNVFRVESLLSLPVKNSLFSKSGIDFDTLKQDIFKKAIQYNQLEILKTLKKHNNNSCDGLIENYWGYSFIYAIDFPRITSFLLDNKADAFADDMAHVKRTIKQQKLDTLNIYLTKVPFSIESLNKLLPLATNANIYDAIENKLIELKNQRDKKQEEKLQKQLTHENNQTWFPMGKFQILHVETANDPFNTTVKHLFNFKAKDMTRTITDNKSANTSETFRFVTIPDASEFIEEALRELKKTSSNLPDFRTRTAYSKRQKT